MNRMLSAASVLMAALSPWMAQANDVAQNNCYATHKSTKQQPKQSTYVPGEIPPAGQLPAGYSASASYKCREGYDLYFTADYILWNWAEGSLRKGAVIPVTQFGHQHSIVLEPDYASGFQVGFGYSMPSMDDWNLNFNYTWYQNSVNEDLTVSTDTFYFVPRFAHRALDVLSGIISNDQKIKYNEFNLLLERPFYFGKRLTANFGAGLGSLWIVQNGTETWNGVIQREDDSTLYNSLGTLEATVKAWSLGPKFMLDTNWLLGEGIAILANAASSVLYTSYYELDATLSDPLFPASIAASADKLNTLRPVLQMFLGLGWNGGFCNDNYRLGVTAGFDFNAFWDYDMLQFVRNRDLNYGADMFLYGLNIQARFDF